VQAVKSKNDIDAENGDPQRSVGIEMRLTVYSFPFGSFFNKQELLYVGKIIFKSFFSFCL